MKNVFRLLFGCANKMATKETMNEAIEEGVEEIRYSKFETRNKIYNIFCV